MKNVVKNAVKLSKKGFTLVEILIVVLIIGILAAIAVPKYQLAVGKSKFSTVKNMAKAIAQAEEVYYLANGKYTKSFADLDITKPSNINCHLWAVENGQQAVACYTTVNNIQMRYYQMFIHGFGLYSKGKRICFVDSADKTIIPNKICQQETGKEGNCDSSNCSYVY